jgi:transcriptional regulator with XRE-family HTH domain
MPSGSQGKPLRLSQAFSIYLEQQRRKRGLTVGELAAVMDKSLNYVATRLRNEAVFNLNDFEMAARGFDLTPDEMLARVRLLDASDYEGRLVPDYEVVSGAEGRTVYLVRDVDPEPRPGNVIAGRFGVGTPGEDEPGVKQPPAKQRTAARKGTTKADDAPHAE